MSTRWIASDTPTDDEGGGRQVWSIGKVGVGTIAWFDTHLDARLAAALLNDPSLHPRPTRAEVEKLLDACRAAIVFGDVDRERHCATALLDAVCGKEDHG